MPNVEVEIGNRRYSIACRTGEEDHLRSVAAIVDTKAKDATSALGNLGENRQLLFASLLLADEVLERRAGHSPTAADAGLFDTDGDDLADALERLAERIESVAEALEGTTQTS
jgi:cell division protein ZapA